MTKQRLKFDGKKLRFIAKASSGTPMTNKCSIRIDYHIGRIVRIQCALVLKKLLQGTTKNISCHMMAAFE
ncbi:MAG: hypothetical protein CMD92_08990 [Gammaproteobacteria bacterium]|nr:hypothetical protein [Gammaproteobacteria bacterium]HBW84862.1 hypothetical protein [Gammaproteobacteria bacterium]